MRRINWILVAVSLVSTATAVALWLELQAESAHGDALQARVAALESSHAKPVAYAPEALRDSSSTEPSTGVAASEAGSAASVTNSAMTAYDDSLEFERRMLANPKYREARKTGMKLQLRQWREDAIRLIGMTPQQADKVFDSMIDSQLDWSARPNPKDPNDEAEAEHRRRQGEEDERRRDAAIRELVGDAKAAQWNQYLASLPSRGDVRQLRVNLVSSAEPLREDQFEPLVAALHVERAQYERERDEFYASLNWDEANRAHSSEQYQQRNRELQDAANERSRAAAAAILSASQLVALDAMFERQLEFQRAAERMDHAMQEAKAPPVAKSN